MSLSQTTFICAKCKKTPMIPHTTPEGIFCSDCFDKLFKRVKTNNFWNPITFKKKMSLDWFLRERNSGDKVNKDLPALKEKGLSCFSPKKEKDSTRRIMNGS